MNRFQTTLLLLGILFFSSNIFAQDTHYWNLQYGTRSTLLGGAVIGSVADIAATYYNPAAPALFPKPEILLSGKVYQLSSFKLKNGGGEGKDLDYSAVNVAPSIFAGSFTFDWLGDNALSYSILTRQHMNYSIEGRNGGISEANPDNLVGREIISDQDLSDLWIGLTWSKKIGSNFAIGVSPYLSVRDQRTRRHAYNEIRDITNGDVSAGIYTQQFEYKIFSLMAKIGVAAIFDKLTLGLTVTTPYLTITGTGSSLMNLINTGAGSDSNTIFIANNQVDVEAAYKTPLSVGFGLGYKIGKHKIHLSAEYYDAIAEYDVLDTEEFTGQSDGITYKNRVSTEAKSVLNYGIGGEFYLKEKLWLFISFVTDYTASVANTETNLGVSNWDIFHLSGGVLFTVGRSEITLGANFAFGNKKLGGDLNLPDSEIGRELEEILQNAEMDYKRIKLLLGFSFELN